MALMYNNVRPLDISYNGTQINELKHNGQGVWGRPFSLSITKTVQATVNVNRTSSPNQGAELGYLSDGSTIYYGDVLVITSSFISGYTSDEHSINGKNFDSGETVTVTEALDIVVTAKESYSWHIEWTGSKSLTTGYQTIKTTDKLGLNYKLYITTYNQAEDTSYPQAITLNAGESKTLYGDAEMYGDLYTETVGKVSLDITMDGLKTNIRVKVSTLTGDEVGDPYTITLTKIEAYY
jgi:hypothetical protein